MSESLPPKAGYRSTECPAEVSVEVANASPNASPTARLTRRRGLWLGGGLTLAVALGLGWWAQWGGVPAGHTAGRSPELERRADSDVASLVGGESSGVRTPAGLAESHQAGETSGAATQEAVALASDSDPLRAMLETLAQLEGQVLIERQSPPDPAARKAIEALLRPTLGDLDVARVVLARLESGEFAAEETAREQAISQGTGSLSKAEFGALRYLYWSIATHGSVHSEWFPGDLGASRQLLSQAVLSLAHLDVEVGLHWVEQVTDLGDRLPGLMDEAMAMNWLEQLRLEGVDGRVHRALALALSPHLSAGLGTAYLVSLVDELSNPGEVGQALQLLLESGDTQVGLDLALAALERTDAGPELREAVFDAVRLGAPVVDAVGFLASHGDLLGNPPNLFLGLGYRDDAPEAMYERYLSELAGTSDPDLRRKLMGGLSKLDAARLEDITRNDPDLEVRAHASLKLFNQKDGDPRDLFALATDVLGVEAMDSTGAALGSSRSYLRSSLGALLRRSDQEDRSLALDYVRQLVRTEPFAGNRARWIELHAEFAEPEVHASLVGELGS